MGRKLDYRDVFYDISEEVEIILQAPHIKLFPKKGLHVAVYGKSDVPVINAVFGKCDFSDESINRVAAIRNLKRGWKRKNSGGSDIIAGVAIGREHIVSVYGLDPMENSAVAILLLACIENTDRDYVMRPKMVQRMHCQKEAKALAEYRKSMMVVSFLPDLMANLFADIKKMKHIQKQRRTGFVIKVYEREFGQCISQTHIGLLRNDVIDELAINAHGNACWLLSNPHAITSAERDQIYAGAILGRRHIVSIDGLDPNDNSSLSIFVLSLLENDDEDFESRKFYIERAMCLHEMYSFVMFLIKECNRIDIKAGFEWVLPMLEEKT